MARKDGVWQNRTGSYIETTNPTGYDILINGTNRYLNFGVISGSTGYGIRDNGGTMEFKNSGGSWTTFGSGGGGGTWGSITGTLSDQTDLQNALDLKLAVTTAASTYAPITAPSFLNGITVADTVIAGSGSLAGSLISGTQTWNTTGTPTAWKLNVTDTASNAASLLMDLQVAGVSQFKVSKSGVVTANSVIESLSQVRGSSFRITLAGSYIWNTGSQIKCSTDSIIVLLNSAGTDFNRLQFGGTTSSYPSIKRSSAILQARLADDSAHTDIEVADEAYGVGWNGSLEVPTKNALYDKIETLGGGGATTALDNLTGVAINAALVLGTSDAFALGSVTKMWSDLFLASGAVINFNAGDVTMIHSAGTLTFNNTAIALGSGAITTTGNVTGNSWLGSTSVRAGAAGIFYWNTRSQMQSPSDGVITMWNTANTDFGRLQLGGTTSSFPAIKRSSTTIAFRLADDSADAPISVSNINVSGSMYLNADNKARISGNTNGVFDFNYNTAGTGGLNFWGGGTTAVWSVDYLGNTLVTTLELGHATDTTLSRVSGGVIAVEGVTIPSISSTSTLTNKRITKRVLALSAGSATPAINTDSYDVVHITAQSAAITSFTSSLTGTPVDGDTLRISITDDGTARALTWGASFEASTVALPTTTVISTRLDVGFIWNTETTKWRCVAIS